MKIRFLALLPLFALAGCNSSAPTENAVSAAPEKEFKVALITPGDVNDQGWNQLAFEGLQSVEKAGGAKISHQVTKNASDRQPAMRDYADQGYDLVICHGFEFGNDAKAIAPGFKNTKFIVVSGNVTQSPNVATLVPKVEDGAYLCGMAAGGVSKSGVVGLIGGGKFPVIQSTFDAFALGARAINPKIKVLTGYVGDFEDQNKGREIARSQISQGADVLFHNADQAGKGMFQAAQDAKSAGKSIYVFGSNRNQNSIAPDVTLGSAIIEMPRAFQDAAKSVKTGTFKPEFVELNLKNKTIQVEWNSALKPKIPAAVMEKIEAAQKSIESGKLKIKRNV
ncbi:MAG TPA: BMP family protein [Abditibacterium sp.]|jgi:basic membrane lipoprotein Med (substrate-binding protein (PBP1-ABC) superfamily)